MTDEPRCICRKIINSLVDHFEPSIGDLVLLRQGIEDMGRGAGYIKHQAIS